MKVNSLHPGFVYMNYDTMLIDGKNLIYRAVYASKSGYGNDDHPILIFFRVLYSYKSNFRPDKIHIFWDVKKEKLWRTEIYPDYKDARNTSDVAEDVSSLSKMVIRFLSKMNCTQYIRDKNEADDLIYAFVKSYTDRHHLVVTADGDANQLTYKFDNVSLYNPNKKNFKTLEKPAYDPIIVKALAGDKSDNIKNYPKVGDLTAQKLIRENKVEDFLKLKGRELFDLNVKLIDFDKNPHLEDNIKYVRSVPENNNFNIDDVKSLINEYKVFGLLGEVNRLNSFKVEV